MKNYLFLIVSGVFSTAFGQMQLENPGFEDPWENVTGPEDEPAEWSSLKTADALGLFAPVVLFQTEDAHSGTYAVHLINDESAGVVANGIMTNGQVHADFDPEEGYVYTNTDESGWNTPFTDRPDSLVAWIKYAPTGSDHGKLELLLHNNSATGILPESGSTAHWIGKARFDVEGSYGSWTRISAPFNYFSAADPSYALMVVTSGDSTVAAVGSELWVDDIELIYNPPMAIDEEKVDFKVYPVGDEIIIELTETNSATFTLYNLDGRLIAETEITENTTRLKVEPEGMYLYRIVQNGKVISGKIYV